MTRMFIPSDTSPWPNRIGDGHDGALTISADTTYDGANAGIVGTATPNTPPAPDQITLDAVSTFANGDLIMIHQSRGSNAGSVELNRILSGGGTLILVLAYPLQNTYVDDGSANQAQVIEVKEYTNITIDATFTWTCNAWDGGKGGILPYVWNGTRTVNGTISVAGKGYRGGTSNGNVGNYGEGTLGDRSSTFVGNNADANGSGGGGGWQNNNNGTGNGGGGGGHAAAGSNGNVHFTGGVLGDRPAGTGGNLVGDITQATLLFGGGGGSGGSVSGGAGVGGNGGGIHWNAGNISVVDAAGVITVAGSAGTSPGSDHLGGGGGGAGGTNCEKYLGSTALESDQMTAAGGAGGTGCGSPHNSDGGAGSVGRNMVGYKTPVPTGTTVPTYTSIVDELYTTLYANDALFSQSRPELQQLRFYTQDVKSI